MFGIPFLTPSILGAIGIALIASLAGGWASHKWDGIALSKSQAQTAQIDAAYKSYVASTAAAAAKADSDALSQKQAQDAAQTALEAKLAQAQQIAASNSQKLKDILNHAAPQDVRALGPVSLQYFAGLRHLQTANTAPGH